MPAMRRNWSSLGLTQSIAILLKQHLHLCHKGNHDRMPGVLPVLSRCQYGAQNGVAITDNHRSDKRATGANDQEIITMPDTEGSGESRERGSRQGWKQCRGCRRAQEAEAQELPRGIVSSHRGDAKTASAKRARHQSAVLHRIRHHRAKPAERSDLWKSSNSALHRSSAREGSRPWAGTSVLSGLGRVSFDGSSRKGRSWESRWLTWKS